MFHCFNTLRNSLPNGSRSSISAKIFLKQISTLLVVFLFIALYNSAFSSVIQLMIMNQRLSQQEL